MLWCVTTGGKHNPLDPEPTDEGNVILLPVPGVGPTAITLHGSTLEAARKGDAVLRTSHFATCPDASEHRKERSNGNRD